MKIKLNLIVITGALILTQPVLAASNCRPFYIGAQIGGCNLHYEDSQRARNAIAVDDTGFAGRLLAGFDINHNIGLELGYTRYENPEFRYSGHVTSDFKQESLDFLAKFSLPVSFNVGIYAKAGMAFVQRGDSETNTRNVSVTVHDSDSHLRPMLGLGLAYGFNSRVTGDIGYFRTFGTDDLEDADFYGAGITFRIG